MYLFAATTSDEMPARANDEWVFGWDPTPGIVSVWASRDGRAVVWRREGQHVLCVKETFRPWLFSTTLDDLTHLGSRLTASPAAGSVDSSRVSYRLLEGPVGSYRYLLTTPDGGFLERALLTGASRRLDVQRQKCPVPNNKVLNRTIMS